MATPVETKPSCQLREYFTPYSYTYAPHTSIYGPNRGEIYEIHGKVDELPQKLDHLLNIGHSPVSSLPPHDVCVVCLSPTHFAGECLATPQFSEL